MGMRAQHWAIETPRRRAQTYNNGPCARRARRLVRPFPLKLRFREVPRDRFRDLECATAILRQVRSARFGAMRMHTAFRGVYWWQSGRTQLPLRFIFLATSRCVIKHVTFPDVRPRFQGGTQRRVSFPGRRLRYIYL